MIYQTESKFQCWRAVAVSNDGEALLHLGRSSDQVQRGYPAAFAGLLDSDERASVRQIVLQCWAGVADQGRWATKAVLPIPAHKFPPPSPAWQPLPVEAGSNRRRACRN